VRFYSDIRDLSEAEDRVERPLVVVLAERSFDEP
jgi:hypothetical protein